MNTLRALKRSPLGLDLYVWLVYRTFTMRAPLCLSWRQVLCQFGADPAKESCKPGFPIWLWYRLGRPVAAP